MPGPIEEFQDKTKKESLLENIRSLMEMLNLTANQAMDALNVPADKQAEYRDLIPAETPAPTLTDKFKAEVEKEISFEHIRILMRTLDLTLDEAMSALLIPYDKRDVYRSVEHLMKLCNYIDEIEEDTKKESLLENIRSLMETLNFTASQAMDALQVPADKQDELRDLI